jgi:hypothetical protein
VGELLSIQRNGNGFRASRHAVRTISGGVAFQYYFDVVDRYRNYLRTPRKLLSPLLLKDRIAGFAKNAAANGIESIAVSMLGSNVYAHYKPGSFTTRDVSGLEWEASLQAITDAGLAYAADGGNAYTLKYADRIIGIPMGSSGFRAAAREIPFYQMVINGYIPYSGKPANTQANQADAFLRMIEYGAYPSYELFYAESQSIRDADNFTLLSGHYKTWSDEAVRDWEAVTAVRRTAAGSPMVRHEEVIEQVFAVTYENGAKVYVNYRDEDVVVEGILISAKWYALAKT